MTDTTFAKQRWLNAIWPFVRANLPPEPCRVLEIGCGPTGGFVPAMRKRGYHAIGVDPAAPTGPGYHQTEFEHHEPAGPVDAIVACASLHHVSDLDHNLDRCAAALTLGGVLIVARRPRLLTRAPYFFPDLHPAGKTDEHAAVDSGQIQATGIRYVATRPPISATPVDTVHNG